MPGARRVDEAHRCRSGRAAAVAPAVLRSDGPGCGELRSGRAGADHRAPRSDRTHLDVFFLPNPAASLAVLTLLTYVLAAVHEFAHVLAAAALGVPARLRITRRLNS